MFTSPPFEGHCHVVDTRNALKPTATRMWASSSAWTPEEDCIFYKKALEILGNPTKNIGSPMNSYEIQRTRMKIIYPVSRLILLYDSKNGVHIKGASWHWNFGPNVVFCFFCDQKPYTYTYVKEPDLEPSVFPSFLNMINHDLELRSMPQSCNHFSKSCQESPTWIPIRLHATGLAIERSARDCARGVLVYIYVYIYIYIYKYTYWMFEESKIWKTNEVRLKQKMSSCT
jgi:hypothetical protein